MRTGALPGFRCNLVGRSGAIATQVTSRVAFVCVHVSLLHSSAHPLSESFIDEDPHLKPGPGHFASIRTLVSTHGKLLPQPPMKKHRRQLSGVLGELQRLRLHLQVCSGNPSLTIRCFGTLTESAFLR